MSDKDTDNKPQVRNELGVEAPAELKVAWLLHPYTKPNDTIGAAPDSRQHQWAFHGDVVEFDTQSEIDAGLATGALVPADQPIAGVRPATDENPRFPGGTTGLVSFDQYSDEEISDYVEASTVGTLMDQAKNHPDVAARFLDAELARDSGDQRSTLVDSLQKIVDKATAPTDS